MALLHLLPILLSLPLLPFVNADLCLDGGSSTGGQWDTNAWRSQVDGVMGGQSSGSLTFLESNTILSYTGDVVLDGGGFSSVRKSFDAATDLSSYDGIVVQLETTRAFDSNNNNPPLGLHLQFGDTVSRYIGFASAFAIPLSSNIGEEVSVFLPLDSFDRGSRAGWQCNNCQIDFRSVVEMDVYVLFQAGPFDVRVKSVCAVDNVPSFPSPSISFSSASEIKSLVDSTIDAGGGLYDKGYRELCIAIYKSVLNSILAAKVDGGAISQTTKSMICQGLKRASSQMDSKVDSAWSLRYTLDAILVELGYGQPSQGTHWRPDATMNAYECSAVTSGAYVQELVSSSVPSEHPTGNPMTDQPSLSPSSLVTAKPSTNILPAMSIPSIMTVKLSNMPSIVTPAITSAATTTPGPTLTNTINQPTPPPTDGLLLVNTPLALATNEPTSGPTIKTTSSFNTVTNNNPTLATETSAKTNLNLPGDDESISSTTFAPASADDKMESSSVHHSPFYSHAGIVTVFVAMFILLW